MRFLLAILWVFLPLAAMAQDAPSISLDLAGIGKPAISLNAEALAAFPAIEEDVTFKTSKGEEHGHYKGVLLWDVLSANGLGSLPGHNEALQHGFVVEGSDGYKITFSVGEIMPDFGNRAVMIATEIDGKPYAAEGLRLIVPGDARGARSVKDIATIAVR